MSSEGIESVLAETKLEIENLFLEAYQRCGSRNRGVLHFVIRDICEIKEQSRDYSKKLLHDFQVNEWEKVKEDYVQVKRRLLEFDRYGKIGRLCLEDTSAQTTISVLSYFARIEKEIQEKPLQKEEMKDNTQWIIGIIVGAFFLICLYLYVESTRNKGTRRSGWREESSENDGQKKVFAPPPLRHAILHLIVPARAVSRIQPEEDIEKHEVEALVSEASYFLCTELHSNSSSFPPLNLTNKEFASDSQQEVYVRVDIGDSQNMVGENLTYTLKINLPSGRKFAVKEVASLSDLSGLEKFNRV